MALLTRHSVGAHQGNDLVRNSPGNPRPQCLGSLSHFGLIRNLQEWN